jgi:hypothetical protein
MSSGIDYSKWDHFDDSSSSEEEQPYPRVTRLEAPSQVSTRDGTISIQQMSNIDRDGSTSPPTAKNKTEKSMDEYKQEWTMHGGTCDDRLYWSQDRETVVLRMEVSSEEGRTIDVTLQGAIPYVNRHCATTTETCRLRISSTTTHNVILEGELPHAVYVEENDDNDNDVEWMVETVLEQHKYLVITLYKATPMPNMTIWWKRPMTQFQEIDVDVPTSASKFQETWMEAHEQFTKKIRQGKVSRQSDKHE